MAIALVGLAMTPFPSGWWRTQDVPLDLEWWTLVPVFAVSEIFVVHYHFRRESYSFTLSELPLALGLYFASLPAIIVARLIGGGLALRLHRKQGLNKIAFNLACNILETVLAVLLFRLLAGHTDGGSLRAVLAGTVAIFTAVTVVTICIALAIVMHDDRPSRRSLVRLFAANTIVAGTNVSLAMVAVAVMWVNRPAGSLLLLVGGILFFGYRSYARLQQKHDDLELLYDFTRRTGSALEINSEMREVLGQVGVVLRARVVELVVRAARDGAELVRTRLVDGGDVTVTTMDDDRLWQRILGGGQSILAATPVVEPGLQAELRDHGVTDALVSPLRSSAGGVMGMMLVGDRLGGTSTFTADDFKLFEALVNHASVSLENRHLIDRLRQEAADKDYQALHDSLTGLPNRKLFQERIERALLMARAPSKVAVLLLDLDRFKEVNDTLGHHNGDLLLQEIGARLRRILRAGDTVARLGGDEYAVLLPDLSTEEAAVAAAEGIRSVLERPFSLGEVNLDVGCSVGIAIWPDHGDDATVLLQRADVAMYTAKTSMLGVEVYDAARDTYSLERLALVGELRAAIDEGRLSVHYQPKADVATGRLLGMEALVRWNHHRQGFIPPEEIIGIAEQTGLIRPLTLWVLNQALRQCWSWRRAGHDFTVAVNLSVRNILDAELPGDVIQMLTDYGLPASALTFEITESSIMADPERTIAVLGRLRKMGIRLAIDDFGTGYSSFSYLRRLPVDELKIDKSFVQHLAVDDNDLVIVRSIVDLGRNLGLEVVAEGVEDILAWQRLAGLGAHTVQGYVLTPALPPLALAAWVQSYQPLREPSGGTLPADVLPLRSPASWRP